MDLKVVTGHTKSDHFIEIDKCKHEVGHSTVSVSHRVVVGGGGSIDRRPLNCIKLRDTRQTNHVTAF